MYVLGKTFLLLARELCINAPAIGTAGLVPSGGSCASAGHGEVRDVSGLSAGWQLFPNESQSADVCPEQLWTRVWTERSMGTATGGAPCLPFEVHTGSQVPRGRQGLGTVGSPARVLKCRQEAGFQLAWAGCSFLCPSASSASPGSKGKQS